MSDADAKPTRIDVAPFTITMPEAPVRWAEVFGRVAPVEIEVGSGNGLFLTTELFYKNANLSLNNGGGSTTVQVLGLQLALIFY